ncbi:MAG: Fe-S cluster assembly protein SufD [Flavobacteriales bacterium]|nr:Fe-S cluster assembly protein SufD [Flavobacteriales bacterium]
MAEDFTALYELNRDGLCEASCSTVSHTRENAVVELETVGMPNNRLEYWKYSRIGKVLKDLNINLSNKSSAIADSLEKPKDSSFEILSLNEAIKTNHPAIEKHLTQHASIKNNGLTALNTAFFSDGIFMNIPDNTDVADPIYIPNTRSEADGVIDHPRNLIVVGENSSVTIISETASEDNAQSSLVNAVEEVIVGNNAQVKQYVLQNALQNEVNSIYVRQGRDSIYTRVTTTLKGAFIRNNINVIMDGTGSESNLYGYYHITGKSQVDNHTVVEHQQPDCVSNELYVGLLDDDASGIFNGRVWVHQDAQRTNAFQSNKNILLSDNATMNTKPELEIYADDVKCSHGATIGQVDPEALFYLQSRGIPKQKAMAMLLQGFSIEVLDMISDEKFRDKVLNLVLEQLSVSQ